MFNEMKSKAKRGCYAVCRYSSGRIIIDGCCSVRDAINAADIHLKENELFSMLVAIIDDQGTEIDSYAVEQ